LIPLAWEPPQARSSSLVHVPLIICNKKELGWPTTLAGLGSPFRHIRILLYWDVFDGVSICTEIDNDIVKIFRAVSASAKVPSLSLMMLFVKNSI